MNRRRRYSWAGIAGFLVLPLLTAAECGEPGPHCIDFRGRTIEFQVADPGSCVATCGDVEITLPDTFQVSVTEETGIIREWPCDVPRADLLTPLPGLTTDRPSFEDAGLWLAEGTQITLGEHVTIDSNGCSGEFYASLSTLPYNRGPLDPEPWLQPDDEVDWSIDFIFYPNDRFACGLPEQCEFSFCNASARSIE